MGAAVMTHSAENDAPMCDEPHPLNRAKCYRDKGHDGQHEAYTQGRVFAWGRVIPPGMGEA